MTKLDWLNGLYIRRMKLADLTKACAPFLKEHAAVSNLEKIVSLFQERLKRLAEINELASFFFNEQLSYDPKILIPKKKKIEETVTTLELVAKTIETLSAGDFEQSRLKAIFEDFVSEHSLNNTIVLWPLRVAITGREASPGVFEVMAILGQQKVMARLNAALAALKKT